MLIGIALASFAVLLLWWAGVRERHQWSIWHDDPNYPRFGATNVETFRWWLAGFRKPCDKEPAKRRPRRAF